VKKLSQFVVLCNFHPIGFMATPPHPSIKGCKEVAHEAVVNYRKWVTTKPMHWDRLSRRVKTIDA